MNIISSEKLRDFFLSKIEATRDALALTDEKFNEIAFKLYTDNAEYFNVLQDAVPSEAKLSVGIFEAGQPEKFTNRDYDIYGQTASIDIMCYESQREDIEALFHKLQNDYTGSSVKADSILGTTANDTFFYKISIDDIGKQYTIAGDTRLNVSVSIEIAVCSNLLFTDLDVEIKVTDDFDEEILVPFTKMVMSTDVSMKSIPGAVINIKSVSGNQVRTISLSSVYDSSNTVHRLMVDSCMGLNVGFNYQFSIKINGVTSLINMYFKAGNLTIVKNSTITFDCSFIEAEE